MSALKVVFLRYSHSGQYLYADVALHKFILVYSPPLKPSLELCKSLLERRRMGTGKQAVAIQASTELRLTGAASVPCVGDLSFSPEKGFHVP